MVVKLNKGKNMNTQKIQAMDMNLDKVINYSVYVDCFARILREFLENGYDNIKKSDVLNMALLLEKYSHRLHICITKTCSIWEF